MNDFNVIGRITKKPELKYTKENKAIMQLDLAINNSKDDTTFLPIKVFGNQAENINKYLNKGSQIAITGIIKNNNYTDKDGIKRYEYNFIARTVEFLSSKTNEQKSEEKINDNTKVFEEFGNQLEIEENITF